jgi:hypothetical protein
MPGGQFYSPFGWGFYGPGYVYGAPVVYVPVVVAGGVGKPVLPVKPVTTANRMASGVMVPVNPNHMPAIGVRTASPASFQAASAQSARIVSANGGLRTYSGTPVSRGGGFSGGSMPSGGGFSGGASRASSGGSSFGGGGGMSHASSGGGSGGSSHGK